MAIFKQDDYYTIKAMRLYGGSFVKALAKCFEKADRQNFSKLKYTFQGYWNQYQQMGLSIKKQEDEENN